MKKIWLDTIDFKEKGGWKDETQFVRSVGQPYLIANDIPGEPVADAVTDFYLESSGCFRFYVRTKNWKYPYEPGKFKILVDGEPLSNICGKMPSHKWYWEIAGDVELAAGEHTVALHDLTGWLTRCAAVIITDDMDFVPSPEMNRLLEQRSEIKGISTDVKNFDMFDFAVVGAGPGGFAAAVAAARKGLKVALISSRPMLGGNGSKEGTIGFDGAGSRFLGMHETGIANELKVLKEKFNDDWADGVEWLVKQEKNITVFLNELCIDAETKDSKITSFTTVNTITLEKSVFRAKLYADCTGDAWLGYYAGAYYRIGREAKWQYNEELAPEVSDTLTMSGTLCGWHSDNKIIRAFRSIWESQPQKFEAPDWAANLPEGDKLGRNPRKNEDGAPWWLESPNDFDDLWDDEFVRDEMVCISIGYFNWLKNSYSKKEDYANYRLRTLALHNSKRENRRLIGDYILDFNDCDSARNFEDAVTYTGWVVDLHHPRGIYSGKEGPYYSSRGIPCAPVPFRCLYSKNIDNLMMAGRNISVTHVALGTTRVQSTIVTEGQVIGTAAAYCIDKGITPRGIYLNNIEEFRRILLRDDVTILGLINRDEKDLAINSRVEATSTAKSVLVSSMFGFADEWLSLEIPHFCCPLGTFAANAPEYFEVEVFNDTGLPAEVEAKILLFSDSNNPGDDAAVYDTAKITLDADYKGWYRVPFKTVPVDKKWGILLSAENGVYWRKRESTEGAMAHYTVRNGGEYFKESAGCQLRYSSKIETPSNCDPENVKSGITRSTLTECNAWVSDEKQGLPQSITLTLAEPKYISSVQIITDVDLSYPRLSYQKSPICESTIKDYTVSVLKEGEWVTAAEVKDNINRLSRVEFEKIFAEAVRITVTATAGSRLAKIYEVGIYEETAEKF